MASQLSQDLINDFVGNAHGNFETVKTLLAATPDLLNARAVWNEVALQAAAHMGNSEIAEFLLAQGAPMDVYTAAMLGHKDQVTAFLKNNPAAVNEPGVHNFPLLFFPILHGHLDIAEQLLAAGADINAGGGANTALHGAVMHNQREAIEWLLNREADPHLGNYENKTPLEVALELALPEAATALQNYTTESTAEETDG